MATLDTILDQVVSKPYADKSVSRSQLAEIWNVAMKSVEETLLTKKACNFPNFGVFSLNISKVDLARPDAKSSVVPTFVVATQFTQAANIPAKKSPAAPNALPVSQLNVTRIALEAAVSRDQVDVSLKAILRTMHELIRAATKLSVDVKIGTLLASSESATVRFNQRFQSLLQQLEDVAKPAHLRTVTNLDLVPDLEAARELRERAAQPPVRQSFGSTASAENTFAANGRHSRGGSASSDRGSALGSPRSHSGTSSPQPRPSRRPPAEQQHEYHDDPDYCEVCQARQAALSDKQRAAEQQRQVEARLRQLALEKDSADKREAARQAEAARRKRAEIDEFNKPLMAKSKEPAGRPDEFGDLFVNRTDKHQVGHIDKDAYKTMLAEQIRDKERRLKKEQEAEKQAAASANKAAAEAYQREEQRQWEEKRRANIENKEFLKEQMTLKTDFVPAVLGSVETQFMANRLVSTAEHKQRDKQDARHRANAQLDALAEKRAMAERERQAAIAEGEAERIANQEAAKRQKKEEELRKIQAQQEAAAALLAQMQENKRRRDEEEQLQRESAAYYAVGDHSHDDHDKNCVKCGRTIKNQPAPNRTKSQLIPATRAY